MVTLILTESALSDGSCIPGHQSLPPYGSDSVYKCLYVLFNFWSNLSKKVIPELLPWNGIPLYFISIFNIFSSIDNGISISKMSLLWIKSIDDPLILTSSTLR